MAEQIRLAVAANKINGVAPDHGERRRAGTKNRERGELLVRGSGPKSVFIFRKILFRIVGLRER